MDNKRNADGTWKEGVSGNPAGKPPGVNKEIEEALGRAKGRHENTSLLDNVCDRAYEDTPLAIALLRKRYPDMKQVEVIRKYEGGYAEMTPAEIAEEMTKATIGEKPNV